MHNIHDELSWYFVEYNNAVIKIRWKNIIKQINHMNDGKSSLKYIHNKVLNYLNSAVVLGLHNKCMDSLFPFYLSDMCVLVIFGRHDFHMTVATNFHNVFKKNNTFVSFITKTWAQQISLYMRSYFVDDISLLCV